jgi:hypothetical protein
VDGRRVERRTRTFRSSIDDRDVGLRIDVARELSALRVDVARDMSTLRGDVARDLSGVRSEPLKWSFLFWVGPIATIAALLGFKLRS